MTEADSRFKPGAYITDGVDLFEVTRIQRAPGVMGMSTVRIVVQNCYSLRYLELFPDKIRSAFWLVKRQPVARCPDAFEAIAWEADLAA
jgi:hypothetical protein